jgi:hypothetical protein
VQYLIWRDQQYAKLGGQTWRPKTADKKKTNHEFSFRCSSLSGKQLFKLSSVPPSPERSSHCVAPLSATLGPSPWRTRGGLATVEVPKKESLGGKQRRFFKHIVGHKGMRWKVEFYILYGGFWTWKLVIFTNEHGDEAAKIGVSAAEMGT